MSLKVPQHSHHAKLHQIFAIRSLPLELRRMIWRAYFDLFCIPGISVTNHLTILNWSYSLKKLDKIDSRIGQEAWGILKEEYFVRFDRLSDLRMRQNLCGGMKGIPSWCRVDAYPESHDHFQLCLSMQLGHGRIERISQGKQESSLAEDIKFFKAIGLMNIFEEVELKIGERDGKAAAAGVEVIRFMELGKCFLKVRITPKGSSLLGWEKVEFEGRLGRLTKLW